MKIYLSSTYADLKQHRARLAQALRQAHYEVKLMEEYSAHDARVEFACAGDVLACDTSMWACLPGGMATCRPKATPTGCR